ncbi:hypothetical protein GF395_04175 [Candidatus Uhrbacteria bacterium]|nr:hypothetical protein [Candidatus Uhrbacteria bacterium]
MLIVMLITIGSAWAQGELPVEGVHYSVLKSCPDGKSGTCVRIGKRNINTHAFAKLFKTDQFSIRAENMTSTLAVCEVAQGHYQTTPGMSGVEGRSTNGIWKDCAKDNQYVYLVPGEVIQIPGRKHLSYSEQQAVLGRLQECTDVDCVHKVVAPLTPDVVFEESAANAHSDPVAPESVDVATVPNAEVPVPAPEAPPVSAPTVTESKAAAPVLPTTYRIDVYFALMAIAGFFCLMMYVITAYRFNRFRRTWNDRALKDLDAAERDIAMAQKQADDAKVAQSNALQERDASVSALQERDMQILSLLKTVHDTFFPNADGPDPKKMKGIPDQIAHYQVRIQSWGTQMRDALFTQRELFRKPHKEEAVLSPEFVLETTGLVVAEKQGWSEATAEEKVSIETEKQQLVAIQLLLKELMYGLYFDLTGETSDTLGDTPEQMKSNLREHQQRICSALHDQIVELAGIVLDESSKSQTHPFDFSQLSDLAQALRILNKEIGDSLIEQGEDSTSLPPDLASRLSLARYRLAGMAAYKADLEQLEGRVASMQIRERELEEALRDARSDSGVRSFDTGERPARTGNTIAPPAHGSSSVPPPPNEVGTLSLPETLNMGRGFVENLRYHARNSTSLPLDRQQDWQMFKNLWGVLQPLRVHTTEPSGELRTFELLTALKSSDEGSRLEESLTATA